MNSKHEIHMKQIYDFIDQFVLENIGISLYEKPVDEAFEKIAEAIEVYKNKKENNKI